MLFKIIKLTTSNKKEIYLRADQIQFIEEGNINDEKGSTIRFLDGFDVFVKETPSQVMALLSK